MYSKKKHSIFISYQGQVSLEYTLKMLISARVFLYDKTGPSTCIMCMSLLQVSIK